MGTTYKKRTGTGAIQGQLYETNLISLILFRLQRNVHIEQFYLASNFDGIGQFDDICFRANIIGRDKPILVFIQAKHKERDDVFLEYDMIENFYPSFLKIKEEFSSKDSKSLSDKCELFRGNFHDTECYFVLYTNAKYYRDSFRPVAYKGELFNDLLLTGGEESQICVHNNDKGQEILKENILEQEIIALAEHLTKFLNDKSMNIMHDPCILRYHVILAQHVVHVSEVQSKELKPNQQLTENNQFRVMAFRQDFFCTNDDTLKKLKKKIIDYQLNKSKISLAGKKEILEGQLKIKPLSDYSSNYANNNQDGPTVEDQISIFLSEPSALTLSPLIDRHIIYENEQLKFTDQSRSHDLYKLEQVNISSPMVEESLAIQTLLNLKLEVPITFGNIDLIIKGNKKKAEKRLNRLTTKLDSLCEKAKLVGLHKVVTIEEEDGFSVVNGDIGGTIGNLLIHDDVTKHLMFTAKCDSLQTNARSLYDRLRNVRNFLDLYRFDTSTVINVPKLVFDYTVEVKEILNKVLVLEKQGNHKRIEQILTDEIEKHQRLQQNYLFKPDKNKIYLYYHSRVQEWWMQKDVSPLLTKTNNLYDETINNTIDEPQMSAMFNAFYTNNIEYFKYDFTPNAMELYQRLKNHSTTIVVTDNIMLTTAKVIRWTKHNYDNTYSVVDVKLLLKLPQNEFATLIDELSKTIKVIIIVCNNKVINRLVHKRLDELATAANSKNKIVITDDTFKNTAEEYFEHEYGINEKLNIMDMTPASRKVIIQGAKILFQGQEVSLDKLVKNHTLIKGAVFNKILCNEAVTVGKSLRDPQYDEIKHLYIDRRITNSPDCDADDHESRYMVQGDEQTLSTFNDVNIDAVVITSTAGMGKSTLFSHMSYKTNEDGPQYWIVRINLLEHTNEFTKWKTDSAVVNSITILSFFCRVTLENYTIGTSLQDTDNVITLKDDGGDESDSFEVNLFLHYFNEGKVVLLFDGFDEICPDYKDQVINMLEIVKNDIRKPKIWVSSRSYSEILPALESVLGKSYTLQCIDTVEQATYLRKFWERKIPLESLSVKKRDSIISHLHSLHIPHTNNRNLLEVYGSLESYLLSSAGNTDKSPNRISNTFLGTPLLLYLLADHIGDLVANFDPIKLIVDTNLFHLYRTFVEKKLIIFFENKYNVDLSKPHSKKQYEKELEECFAKYKKMGAYVVFRKSLFQTNCQYDEFKDMPFNYENQTKIKEIIENFKGGGDTSGVISYVTSDNIPVFIHMTFAEYFAAEFISDIFKNKIFSNGKKLLYSLICFYEYNMYHDWIKQKRRIDKTLDRIITTDLELDKLIGNKIIFRQVHYLLYRRKWTLEQYLRLHSSSIEDYEFDVQDVLDNLNWLRRQYLSDLNRFGDMVDVLVAGMKPHLRKYFPDA